MSDTNRPIRLGRRAVLGGLLVGVAAASAPLAWVRAKDATKDGDAPAARVQSIEVEARPIGYFERGRPEAMRFGQLEFRGGLVLTSPAADFGGWSALVMDAAG